MMRQILEIEIGPGIFLCGIRIDSSTYLFIVSTDLGRSLLARRLAQCSCEPVSVALTNYGTSE